MARWFEAGGGRLPDGPYLEHADVSVMITPSVGVALRGEGQDVVDTAIGGERLQPIPHPQPSTDATVMS